MPAIPASGLPEDEVLAALGEIRKEGGRFVVDASPSAPGGDPASGPAVPASPPAQEPGQGEVSPRELLAAAGTPGASCRLVVGPDRTSLPVAGVEDLAALVTLYAAGASAAASTTHLLGSLKSMQQAGVRFTAVDTRATNDRGRIESRRVEVGAYGAWKALQEAGRAGTTWKRPSDCTAPSLPSRPRASSAC